jgi:methionyl-tRNA formyltransferase
MATVVFMGTPDFAVPTLRKLLETQTVVGIVTQPDRPYGRGRKLRPSPVKSVAQQAGVPIYQPRSLRSEEAAAPLRQWRPDIIVVAAFGHILRAHVLNLPPHGCLNVHASLLPRWRGASPIQHAILAGDVETGVTLMQMDEGMDTGLMFGQRTIPIHDDETAAILHDRLANLGAEMVGECLDGILEGRLIAIPQDETQVTYAPLIKKEDGRLDWQQSAAQLDRRVRAMTPWPGAFTTWQGTNLKVRSARPTNDHLPVGEPGRLVVHQETAVVLTQKGGLELQQIQLAGKQAMNIRDFIHGQPDFIGSKLGE